VKTTDHRQSAIESLTAAARSTEMLSADQEVELAKRAAQGDDRAFERLLKAHLRLVLTIAREFGRYGLPAEELVSEGMLGLVEAARRFQHERGVRLAAYAGWWIRAYMRRYTLYNRRIVRTPSSRHGRRLLANLRKTQRALTQLNGERPDADAVAQALGVGVRDVEEMEAALSGRDVACGHDADGRSVELPSASPSPETIVAETEEVERSLEAMRRAMCGLSPREQDILRHRYLAGESRSLASIGRGMGLSRERVRQLEHQAQAKMRHAITAASV
jgi:RNA polymerase sigma-32 factor